MCMPTRNVCLGGSFGVDQVDDGGRRSPSFFHRPISVPDYRQSFPTLANRYSHSTNKAKFFKKNLPLPLPIPKKNKNKISGLKILEQKIFSSNVPQKASPSRHYKKKKKKKKTQVNRERTPFPRCYNSSPKIFTNQRSLRNCYDNPVSNCRLNIR